MEKHRCLCANASMVRIMFVDFWAGIDLPSNVLARLSTSAVTLGMEEKNYGLRLALHLVISAVSCNIDNGKDKLRRRATITFGH